MASKLAGALDAAVPVSSYKIKQHVDLVLEKLKGEEKRAFMAALSDIDLERMTWRVSGRELARIMQAGGYSLTANAVRSYRVKHYPHALSEAQKR